MATKRKQNPKRRGRPGSVWPIKNTDAEKELKGRPTKCTPEITDRIVSFIRAGNYAETAVAAAGVHRDSYHEWLRRGATGEEPYKTFSDKLNKAYAESEAIDVQIITRAASDGVWQAAAWKLERRAWKRWGKKLEAHIGGVEDGQPVKVESTLGRLTTEELKAMRAIRAKLESDDAGD
jgi:hypothetical protein